MMNKLKTDLDYVDSMMVVDKNLKVLHTNRFNPRFDDDEMKNEYNDYYGKYYFQIYPDIDPDESTMVECLKTGKIIFRENQLFTDFLGRMYNTKNITYPIIRYGEIVGAIELSQDITSIGDLRSHSQSSKDKNLKYKSKLTNDISFKSIITNNHQMLESIKRAKAFSLNDNPVLIYGETGTGKEMFVQAMVNSMGISNAKFITQNCAAIPESLFESILFGTCKGSFTGSEDKIGLFEMADEGVLFLDELNSMPLHLQAKILRVIQDGIVRPIGSTNEKHVNVKIIAATNQNPTQLIKENLLREDLFYRLSSNTLYLVPLRERKEDIPIYINYFIDQFNKIYNKRINKLSTNLMDLLLNYNWPGNVRQLKHIIESMVNVSEQDVLTIQNLPIYFKEIINTGYSGFKAISNNDEAKSFKISLKEKLHKTEKDYIMQALRFTKGNVTYAAELLGLPRQTLKYRIDKLKLDIYNTK